MGRSKFLGVAAVVVLLVLLFSVIDLGLIVGLAIGAAGGYTVGSNKSRLLSGSRRLNL